MTPKLLRLKKLTEISFVDKGASGDNQHAAKVVFSKRQQPNKQGEPMTVKKATPGDAAIEQLKAALPDELHLILDMVLTGAAQGAPVAEPEPVAEEKADDEGEKAPEPEIEKEDEDEDEDEGKLSKRDAKVQKQLDGAIEEIAKLKAEKRGSVFFAKAEKLKFVEGETDEVAKALDEIDLKLSKESKAFVTGLVDKIETGIEKALTVHGSSLSAGDGSAIEGLAKARAREEGISYEQAYLRISKEKPELYNKARLGN